MPADNKQVKLPQDKDSEPIQVLSPVEGTVANLTLSGTTARVALPTGSEIVQFSVSGACHLRFGTGAVNAATTDFYYPAGFVGTLQVPETSPGVLATNIAGIFATGTTTAVLYVQRLV